MDIKPVVRVGFPFEEQGSDNELVGGEGMHVFDKDGKRYADLCSGLWNMPLGYSERRIKEAVERQLTKLPFSNLLAFVSDIQNEYAGRLIKWMGDYACVLYTCGGSEAVEAAVKSCRKYQAVKGRGDRKMIAAFSLSYHGTSYGAMSISGIDQVLSVEYAPLLPAVCWAETPGDRRDEKAWTDSIDEIFSRYGDSLAGFFAEPVLASGGVIPVPGAVLRHIQKKCREYDVLFVMDEVATGFGRTGVPFAFQKDSLSPDLVCLSKAVNNGYLPLGALVYGRRYAELFVEHQETVEHFSTQGGNAAAIAGAMEMLECMRELESYRVAHKGEMFLRLLQEGLCHAGGVEVRGAGLMIAVDFPDRFSGMDLMNIMELCKKRGLIVYMYHNPGYNRGISLFPPFIISEDEIETYCKQILLILRKFL